jgi:hypothetical protein
LEFYYGLQKTEEFESVHLYLRPVFQQGRLLRLSAISPQDAATARLLFPGGGGKNLRPQLRGFR